MVCISRSNSTEAQRIFVQSKGAYVNVACVSENEITFKKEVSDIFMHHRFKVFEIDEIETEENLAIDNPSNAEKITLLNEIKEGYSFAWGTFHTFDE